MGRCSDRDFLKEMTPMKLNWSLQSAEMQMFKEQNFTTGVKGWLQSGLRAFQVDEGRGHRRGGLEELRAAGGGLRRVQCGRQSVTWVIPISQMQPCTISESLISPPRLNFSQLSPLPRVQWQVVSEAMGMPTLKQKDKSINHPWEGPRKEGHSLLPLLLQPQATLVGSLMDSHTS